MRTAIIMTNSIQATTGTATFQGTKVESSSLLGVSERKIIIEIKSVFHSFNIVKPGVGKS